MERILDCREYDREIAIAAFVAYSGDKQVGDTPCCRVLVAGVKCGIDAKALALGRLIGIANGFSSSALRDAAKRPVLGRNCDSDLSLSNR
jgi:hypothetical protein